MQYQECRICITSRRLCSVRRECTILEGLHLQWEDRVCCLIRKSALSGMLQFQYEERKCAGSHWHYEQKLVQCEESVYSIRGVTPAVGGHGVCCEENFCSIRNVTSAV